MTFHANGGFHRRAVMNARQDLFGDPHLPRKVAPTLPSPPSPSTPTTSATDKTTVLPKTTATKDDPVAITPSTSASSLSLRPSSTQQKVVTSPTPPVNKAIISPTTTVSYSSTLTSSSASATPSADTPTGASGTGSVVGGVVGILFALVAIVLIVFFVIKRTRRKRDFDAAQAFNKEKLERPGMVHGIAAGPGVPENNFRPASAIGPPPTSRLPDAPPMSQHTNPFSPVSHPGAAYNSIQGEQDFGAPPMPGTVGPAPYGPYTSHNGRRTTPPGSPFAGGYVPQNPFATPPRNARRLSPPTDLSLGAWPMPPLLPGGAFSDDGCRDSGYSAACSDVHVGQAYKVQVGVSMPKYEDLTRETPDGPPPPFDADATPNTADGVPADAPADVVPEPESAAVQLPAAVKALPPRPPSSQTVYNSEDAYGGV